MPPEVVEKVREVDRVVPVEGRIWLGGARAVDSSFLLFFSFFLFQQQSLLLSWMKRKSRMAAEWAQRAEDCVQGESVDGEGKSLLSKKRS